MVTAEEFKHAAQECFGKDVIVQEMHVVGKEPPLSPRLTSLSAKQAGPAPS